MIDLKTIDQIRQASIEERLYIIELILQSLKKDIFQREHPENVKAKRFKVRKFSLGQEVHVDREDLYFERG
ncbi:MAG: hypothetical protein D6681_06715 [Calditrichaeota bacterium]|nr:MAG: hypothetical protein D6681_06715 [Calditrichota bacterium]